MSKTKSDAVKVETFKSDGAHRKGVERMAAEGYLPSTERAERPRRAWGLLLGIVGYWLLPRKTRITVTFTRARDREYAASPAVNALGETA